MKKFEVTVIETNKYIIEIDEEKYNDEWMESFSNVFHHIESIEEIAEDLAIFQSHFGNDERVIEGYGIVRREGEIPNSWIDYDEHGVWKKPPHMIAEGLNIITTLREDIDVEVEEKLIDP